MDQICINDLTARGILGIDDRERQRPQDILINVTMYADLRAAGQSDNLEDCVNYSTMAKKIQAHAETVQRFTVEALAADLARICLEDHRVQKVRIRVEKPGAVRFTRTVGVEIERSRDDAV